MKHQREQLSIFVPFDQIFAILNLILQNVLCENEMQ